MLPLRQRAACMARQARLRPALLPAGRTARAFASTDAHAHEHGGDHHHHDAHAHAAVDEPMGSAFFIFAGTVPAVWLLYTLAQPGKNGEPTAAQAYFSKFDYLREQWETRNTLHTAAVEQAAHDKNLLYTAPRNTHVELRYPEIFQSSSPYNIPAGSVVNLDKVVAHYQAQYHQEAERQSKAAAAAAAATTTEE